MEMLNNNEEFKHIVRINPSDILNLALDLLSVVIETHDDETTSNDESIELYKSLIDNNKKFGNYSALSFAVSRASNDELNEKLIAISKNKELSNLVKSMLGDDL